MMPAHDAHVCEFRVRQLSEGRDTLLPDVALRDLGAEVAARAEAHAEGFRLFGHVLPRMRLSSHFLFRHYFVALTCECG